MQHTAHQARGGAPCCRQQRLDERAAAWDAVRLRVSEAVPLNHVKPGFSVMMFPDASDKFWGSCITQVPTVELTGSVATAVMCHGPLGFLSGPFRGSQERWATVDKEGFATGSTINGMVNRTGPHGVSIVKWSGHDCVSISHSWPNDVTTRACPTNACVNAVCAIPGCPRRVCTSSSDIAAMLEPEFMSTLTSGPPHKVRSLPNPRSCHHICQAARPRRARNKGC